MSTSIVDRIPTAPLLRPDQVTDMHEERTALQEKLRNPQIQDKGQVRRQLTRLEKQLHSQDPHAHAAKTPDERDALAAEVRRLESEFTTGMLTATEMRRNPPTAVDRHRRWESANKAKILRWKNALRMLEPENTDRDTTNIERLRRDGLVAGPWVDAQIPGHFTLSPQAKANYEGLDFGNYQTATTTTAAGEGKIVITPAVASTCANCGTPAENKYCGAKCRTAFYNRKLADKRRAERREKAAERA